MMRILWVLALFAVIGAHKHEPWRQDMKEFFEALTHEMKLTFQKSQGISPEMSTDRPYTASPARKPCVSTSKCHRTTSTVSPLSTSTSSTEDYNPHKGSSASSTQRYPIQAGSIKGIPGDNFPDYTDIPITSFSCSDKEYVPGFYADLETGCQVFHVCWPHRRESFLCPVGTTFNQALLACDYWYSSNCSLAPHYYNVNGYSIKSDKTEAKDGQTDSMIDVLLGTRQKSDEQSYKIDASNPESVMSFISQFLPVKAKVTVYPGTSGTPSKIVASASVGTSKKREHDEHRYHPKKSQDLPKEPQYSSAATLTEGPKYSTHSPDITNVKYINVEEAVKLIMDRVDEMIKSFVREMKGHTVANKTKELHIPVHTEKPSPLTSLNQRFVIKPAMKPVDKSETSSSRTLTEAVVSSTKPSVADFPRKPLDSKARHTKPSISPMTKKVLAKNYIKFLKIRKA